MVTSWQQIDAAQLHLRTLLRLADKVEVAGNMPLADRILSTAVKLGEKLDRGEI